MRRYFCFKNILLILICLFINNIYAWNKNTWNDDVPGWNHSIEFGYGNSRDPNNTHYRNSGFLLSGDLFPLKRTNYTFWSVAGSVGRWNTTAPTHKNLTTAAASIALRLYPFGWMQHPFYALGSLGPAYLSNKQFGVNKQAYHVAFQSNLGVGYEFNNIDLNLRMVHFSNGDLGEPNRGYNIQAFLSLGYLF